MVTHPHPNPPLEGEGLLCLLNPPLEGEGIFSLLPLQGGGREGDGVRKRNAMLKCDKVELRVVQKQLLQNRAGINPKAVEIKPIGSGGINPAPTQQTVCFS